ncbi:hypothetical protein Plhal710r2_c006g0028041 [Plasmopara halstedii]
MAVKRINDIIKKLDWKEVEATLLSDERDDADPGYEVCKASLEDWERYVKTENQALVSREMAFEDDRIYIVELPSGVHDGFCGLFKVEMVFATGTRDHHLVSSESSYVCVSRGWSYLNRKANQWRQIPGVKYILCIRLSPALRVRQYKLYTVNNRANPLPPMDPIPIVNPTNCDFQFAQSVRPRWSRSYSPKVLSAQ